MTTAHPGKAFVLDRHAVRHALNAERMRARHYHMALASATDSKLKGRCGRQLSASLGRAAELALALIDMGEAVPMTARDTEFDDRLLDAMDLSMRNGTTRRKRSTRTPEVAVATRAARG